MENTDVLIIGAGAAGLMAAYTLTKAGKKVTVLEACNRTGGRIHTLYNSHFFERAELGAEFVHGNLPITLGLLNDAGIAYHHAGGEMWRYENGTFARGDGSIEGWDLLIKKLSTLTSDMTLNRFLETHFDEPRFDELKDQVRRYASGYDTSDPDRVSAMALSREWQQEDQGAQYRIAQGYCTLISYLVDQIKAQGGNIYLNAPVANIKWQPGNVQVTTADGESYSADKVIFAISLGVWQAPDHVKGVISIQPPINEQTQALQKMGFGAIIKVLLQFDSVFWENDAIDGMKQDMKDMDFLLTSEAIPTWWTQSPERSSLLTGWLGGPAAADWKHRSSEEILQEALSSLGKVFDRDPKWLKSNLIAWHVANWTADPYVYGSYAYDTVDTPRSRELLNVPVNDTLYFAGEFMYSGPAMGTVEAALTSGRDVAEMML